MARTPTKTKPETPSTSVAVLDEKPSYLAALEAKGPAQTRDNFDHSDIVVPRIKLLQALSAEVEAFDNAKSGNFWHTGFDMSLGDAVDFVVCSRRKKYLLVAPMEDGQGILARSEDFISWDRTGEWKVKIKGVREPVVWKIGHENVIKSGLDQWGTFNPDDEGSPPAATMFYEYLVLLPNHLDLGPAVLSITRSAIRKARKGLNDKIKLHAGAGRPMQSLVFRMTPVDDKNPDGQGYKNFQFTANGFASEDLYKQALELETALQDYKVADEENLAAEEASAASGGGNSTKGGKESKDF